MGPFISGLPSAERQENTELMPGKGSGEWVDGSAIPFLAYRMSSHPSKPPDLAPPPPYPHPPACFHWQVTGERQEGVGESQGWGSMATWPVSRAEGIRPRWLAPAWILCDPRGHADQTEDGRTEDRRGPQRPRGACLRLPTYSAPPLLLSDGGELSAGLSDRLAPLH